MIFKVYVNKSSKLHCTKKEEVRNQMRIDNIFSIFAPESIGVGQHAK